MTTTTKQLRRKHRKSPKPRKQGSPLFGVSGLERLHALGPAYVLWRTRTVPSEQARVDWSGLLVLLDSLAEIGPFPAPEAFDSKSIIMMLINVFRDPGDKTSQNLELLDGYLHFMQDTGRWPHDQDSFELVHLLVLMRVPGVVDRRTCAECPISLPERNGHGLTLVQWAAYLLDEMIEGKFDPDSNESLAYPVQCPDDVILLAPGLYPLPLMVFKDLFTAMDEAGLFERADNENSWDEDTEFEQTEETRGELYPSYLGMALLQDDHPQNHDAVLNLLTSYLRIVAMALATSGSGLAGVRRAGRFVSVLGEASSESSTAKATWGTNMFSVAEQTKEQVANQFGEISDSVLACMKARVLEYVDGNLIVPFIVREAITNLHDEYAG